MQPEEAMKEKPAGERSVCEHQTTSPIITNHHRYRRYIAPTEARAKRLLRSAR